VTHAIAYTMTDMAPTETVGPGAVSPIPGGCGKSHTAELDDQGRPYIECDQCAPILIGSHYGFAATPAGVPLTPDERAEVEISQRQGQVSYNLAMKALGQTVGQMIQGTTPAAAKMTAADMFNALGDDELAKFRAMLAAPAEPIPPEPVTEVRAPGTTVKAPARTRTVKPPSA
jgi:hypothetical protein